MNSVSSSTSTSSSSLVQNIADLNPERRKILGELAQINKILNQALVDPLSQQIRCWYQSFSQAIRYSAVVQPTVNKFIELLQDILRDPCNYASLDFSPLLASDGRTYNRQSLKAYRDNVSEQLRNRSPLNPSDPTTLTFGPHPIAQEMNQWLKKYNAFLGSEEKELPKAEDSRPNSKQERLQRILQQKVKLDQERAVSTLNFLQTYEETSQAIQQYVNQHFNALDQEIRRETQETFGRLEAIQMRDQQEIQRLECAVVELQTESQILQQEVQALEARITNVNHLITEAESDNIRLQIAIKSTEQAIKDRKKSWMKDLAIAVAIVGVAAFATFALQGALAASGSSLGAAVGPVNGGAKIGFSIAF